MNEMMISKIKDSEAVLNLRDLFYDLEGITKLNNKQVKLPFSFRLCNIHIIVIANQILRKNLDIQIQDTANQDSNKNYNIINFYISKKIVIQY